MRDGAVLVNTGRGEVVDEDALLAELRSGRLWAALDVYATEPLPADHPLRSAPNTVLTPHTGASSAASVGQLRAAMCDTTLQWLSTGWADAVVNPQVRERLRTRPGAPR
jgi:phosphoglycerate dehydrogenase-like enzyme